jgi:glutamate/tyrosine decarboxylase-like PLP-dependent enzyme
MAENEEKHLAWFLGPKAENANLFEELLLVILRDYLHWRRNYFPGDQILINKSMQRRFEDEHDALTQKIHEMIAELRRNFPFYSPRYTAHMLADTTLPSVLGYIAGMLYNPNNVTPEAAPVTVDWEIEACNMVLQMLGYRPPPPLPNNEDPATYYGQAALKEFGWSHITMGGTTANIEALWIARAVKYFPLSVRDISIREHLEIEIKRPNGDVAKLVEVTELETLLLKPNESVYLLEKFVSAIRKKYEITIDEASDRAWKLLRTSKYSLSKGTGELFAKFPPVIFVSGAAHYSVVKAADVLGIGKDNVIIAKMNSMFRLDVHDLEKRIKHALDAGKIPLAVVAIAGTTEEGAVDPIHEVVDLRTKLEKENVSFWLHIDSAWGGYIRSLFKLDEQDFNDWVLQRLAHKSGITYNGDVWEWHTRFTEWVEARVLELIDDGQLPEDRKSWIVNHLAKLKYLLQTEGVSAYRKSLKKFVEDFRPYLFAEDSMPLTSDSILKWPTLLEGLKVSADARRVRSIGRVRELLSKEGRQFIDAYDRNLPPTEEQMQTIIDDLNRILTTESLYDERAFAGLELGKEARAILKQDAATRPARETVRLNRLLFEALYPREVVRSKIISEDDFNLRLQDRMDMVNEFVQDEIEIYWGNYRKKVRIMWGAEEVCTSFIAFPKADSITVDPHKMGYVGYPCGVIAFRNDRVRHFVLQKAPYITSAKQSALAHVPPKHAELVADGSGNTRIHIDSFGAFILEGSRPGASATSLWLSVQTIPLTMKKHGAIVRASLLAARELYEWLTRWSTIMKDNRIDTDYEFTALTAFQPDTNVVIFTVKKRTSSYLHTMNNLTRAVYQRFAIQTELGEREYSYSQPFFISKTTIGEPEYPYEAVKEFFGRCELAADGHKSYKDEGVVILRATVMNPYLYPMKRFAGQNIVKEFVDELARAAGESVKTL